MIVLQSDQDYTIIHQRAHALLALEIAQLLKKKYRHSDQNWTQSLLAIGTHDDGYPYKNESYYVDDAGFPKDFRNFEFEEEASSLIVNNASLRSRWIHLMILKHMEFLHKNTMEAKNFLSEMKKREIKILQDLKISDHYVDQCYGILRWCDELSLQLCFHINSDKEEKIQLPELPNNVITYLYKTNGTYYLEPNPLLYRDLILEIEYKRIPKRRYGSDKDLNNELDKNSVLLETIKINSDPNI